MLRVGWIFGGDYEKKRWYISFFFGFKKSHFVLKGCALFFPSKKGIFFSVL